MKILLALVFSLGLVFTVNSFANEKEAATKEEKKMLEKVLEKPKNIDENNVGITSGEKLDQSDDTLIEGNLEDNDFKN